MLRSIKDKKLYYGYTENLNLRIDQHNKAKVTSTKYRLPLELIYFEACLSKEDTLKREKYFKTFYGNMFIKKRINNYLKLINSSRKDKDGIYTSLRNSTGRENDKSISIWKEGLK